MAKEAHSLEGYSSQGWGPYIEQIPTNYLLHCRKPTVSAQVWHRQLAVHQKSWSYIRRVAFALRISCSALHFPTLLASKWDHMMNAHQRNVGRISVYLPGLATPTPPQPSLHTYFMSALLPAGSRRLQKSRERWMIFYVRASQAVNTLF